MGKKYKIDYQKRYRGKKAWVKSFMKKQRQTKSNMRREEMQQKRMVDSTQLIISHNVIAMDGQRLLRAKK